MAQQLLDAPQVVAGLEQMGCEGMPEQVWVHLGVDTLAPRPVVDTRLHTALAQARAALTDE